MKKAIVSILAVLIILLGAVLHFGPVMLNDDSLPAHFCAAVESQARGVYSGKLWLVPVAVKITDFNGDRVDYTIYYLPFGSVDMSYTAHDGYNIEKPLVGI